MHILSISGENIASLAKPFEIDLDGGDLAGAGLFAITGKTGAGKSSLLDAMCLALYGNCPRLGAAGVKDSVPDPSGEMIQSDDARTLLRRGASVGHAVVRFRGKDGAEYEASWSIRRAYGKPTGKLQNVDRALVRCSDGQVLENQIRRVNDCVVALTGLTYEEFRRSVLLAQGDFDSFLSAQAKERAAILEKVTGTGLYREISRRVYDGTQVADRAVQDLEVKLGEHQVLDEAERAAITARLAEIVGQRDGLAAAVALVQADLDHHARLAEAEERLKQAQATQVEVQTALTAATADRARLDRLRKAALALPAVKAHEDARTAEATAEASRAQAETALTAAITRATTADADLGAAQAEVDRLEAEFKALGPVWTRAEGLDANIQTAAREHADALAEENTRRTGLTVARDSLGALRAARDKIDAATEVLRGAIAGEAAGAVFVHDWDMLQDRLSRRMMRAGAAATAARQIAAIETELSDRHIRLQEIDGLLVQHTALRADRETARREAAEARAPLAAEDPAGRLTRLVTAQASLRGLAQIAQAHVDEADKLQAHDVARAALEQDCAQAESDLARATRALADAESRIAALETPAQMARAAVSDEARALRVHLVDGEPCPVCRATHHPVHEDATLAALARRLRADLDAARKDRNDAAGTEVAKTGFVTQARARLGSMTEERGQITRRLAQLVDDYAAAARTEADGPVAADVPKVIEGCARPVCAALEVLRDKMAGWRQQLEAARDQLATLDRALEAHRQEIDTEDATLARLRADHARVTEAMAPRREALTRLRADLGAAEAEVGAITTELDQRIGDPGALGLPGWAMFDHVAQDLLDALTARRARHLSDVEALRDAEAKRAGIDGEIRLGAAAETTARAAFVAAEQRALERGAGLSDLSKQRSALLDGLPTGAHRTAFNARRTASAEGRDAVAQHHVAAQQHRAAAQAAREAADSALGAARTRTGSAQVALEEASAKTGIPVSELAGLLRDGAAEMAGLEAALSALDTRAIRAEEAVKTRSADLGALRDSHMPDAPVEALTARKAELSEQDDTLAQEATGLATRRALDEAARAKQADIVKALETARGVHGTWEAVNDTVGSRSGDRFSQIAQEVTLAILVEQANTHLADIKPRYRLALGDGKLSLHVVDEDMAGEIRSTRSLSGGERFLVSLGLALALSTVGGAGTISGTLFIDEGFGTLDAESLELAIDALEALQAQGRTVGVISHVQAMKDRIPMQVMVVAQGDGTSEVRVSVV